MGVVGAAVAVLVVTSAWLVWGFVGAAQDQHGLALRSSRLETAVVDIDANEWQARADGRLTAPLEAQIATDIATADRLITELGRHDLAARRLGPLFGAYRAALRVELELLRQARFTAAAHVDSTRVDPAFDRLRASLATESANASAAATVALRWLLVGSALVLASAGGAIWLLVWRSQVRRARTIAAQEHARTVAVSERRFRALVDNGQDIIIVTDRDGVIREISDSIQHVLGLAGNERVGRKVTDLVHPDEVAVAEAEFAKALTTKSIGPSEWRCKDASGAWHHVEASITNLLDMPDVGGVVLNVRDVTDRHRLEEELRHRAFHDSLTGLANRALLRDRIGHAMARRQPNPAALLVLDLDGFKHLNDSLGHLAGDHALVTVADCLQSVSRPGDTVARLGGDEFALLIEDVTQQQVDMVADRIIEAIAQPFQWDGQEVGVGASVGIAFVAPGLHGADDLVRNADVALYAAKAAGRGLVRTFDTSMHDAALARFELERDLRHAINDDQLVLQYQPIVELDTRQLIGFEALIRWQHPTRGLLLPQEFIPIAEETGLIVPIGRWALATACHAAAHWNTEHADLGPLYVSVNISSRQLDDPQIVQDVAAALAAAHLDPEQLLLEITETALMHDTQAALARLNALKALGTRVAVDDFGTGYSSLSYLQRFPIDTIKIDKTFVDDITTNRDDATFLEAVLRLSDTLHLRTVAEGIETREQAHILHELGCQLGQGFHYAEPLDPTDLADLLTRQAVTPAIRQPEAARRDRLGGNAVASTGVPSGGTAST